MVQFQLESNVMTVESEYNDLVTFLGEDCGIFLILTKRSPFL